MRWIWQAFGLRCRWSDFVVYPDGWVSMRCPHSGWRYCTRHAARWRAVEMAIFEGGL